MDSSINYLWRAIFTKLGPRPLPKRGGTKRVRDEADFVEQVLQLSPGAKILGVARGNPQVCLELAERGYHMTIADFIQKSSNESDSMLKETQRKIIWEHCDHPELPWKGEFEGAFCFGFSFDDFDEDGDRDLLKAISLALKPGAGFILETNRIAEVVLPAVHARSWFQDEEIPLWVESRYDAFDGRLEIDYTYINEGEMGRRSTSQRIYASREVQCLLEEAGFAKCKAYSSISREPFYYGATRLLIVGNKNS
ncbi:MAG: hypothetical protein HY326_04340 [Chloroflexi bacterium]|nr:hypothetical protein [Chloroflexota bacterium]